MMAMFNRRFFGGISVLCVGVMVLALVGFSPSEAKKPRTPRAPSATTPHDGCKPYKTVVNPGNKAFYAADGAFDAAPAKEAYFDMMAAFGYPIPAILKTDTFWVADFVQRDFENLGMGGIFWMNQKNTYGGIGTKAYKGEFKDQKFGYLGHEIYLLPGQMLPEHRHIGGTDGYGPKMETWHIRHGSVEFFGQCKATDPEGKDPNIGGETPISDMAAADQPWGFGQDWFKSKYVVKKVAGEMYTLDDPESYHFMRAGPDGAIVSEYATYHNQVEFSKPGLVFDNSKAKQ